MSTNVINHRAMLLAIAFAVPVFALLDPVVALAAPDTLNGPTGVGVSDDDPIGSFANLMIWGVRLLLILVVAGVAVGWISTLLGKFTELNQRNGSLGELIPIGAFGLALLVLATIVAVVGWNFLDNSLTGAAGSSAGSGA